MAALVATVAPTATAAEGERVFDPELSLIGGCKDETLDSVEDPGCPNNTPPASGHPPEGVFAMPRAVATDQSGNIFVASWNGSTSSNGTDRRVDIFSASGVFIDEIELAYGPLAMAVDGAGVLYVVQLKQDVLPKVRQVIRFTPCAPYNPNAGEIDYCNPPDVVFGSASLFSGVAVNPDNDHLFVNEGGIANEFTSAAEGNVLVRKTTAIAGPQGVGMAVDATRDHLFVGAESGEAREIFIFDLNVVEGSPPGDHYKKIGSIGDSSVPGGDIGGMLSVAVDESTGHIFIYDTENANLYEFDEDGIYLTTINEIKLEPVGGSEIGVDNGPTSPNKGVLYVPSHSSPGHSFAFEESIVKAPEVNGAEAVNVSETEAELVAQINPGNAETTYTIEYITEQAAAKNEEEALDAFAGASLAEEGTIPAGNADVEVSAALTGLQPGASYRFRVFAENEAGDDAEEASFGTYPSVPLEPSACPNALLRTGPSALLPDCRAYELVTPPDTGGRFPIGVARDINTFTTRQVSPDGNKLPFKVEGGSLPGYNGTGSFLGDPYLASRTDAGWSTSSVGPNGTETEQTIAGSSSPDQGYSFWVAEGAGTAVIAEVIAGKIVTQTSYVRFPDGHSELIGQGSLGITDPRAVGQLISEGGDHILFTSGGNNPAVQLEPDAAPDGTAAIYDRIPNPATGERETKVVSLKPDGSSFGSGENATYMGSSLDGEGVAFRVGTTLYLRYRNAETFEIGTGLTYAGLAEGGAQIFYLEDGDLLRFDALAPEGERVTDFTTSEDVTPVFIAQGGGAAYFVSPAALAGPNPNGAEPQAGAQNLYLSEEGQLSFVATVTDRDVEGELVSGVEQVDGLGLWVEAANPGFPGRFAVVPARATPDGSVLLFKSRASLTDYDSEDKAQIYRFDSAGALQCLSCNPTGAAPSADATLQTERRPSGNPLFLSQAWLENLRSDGRRAFFESSEPLVVGDSDGLLDVYEWEAQGVGNCARAQGCVQLISSPRSQSDEYIWAVSQSGDDVFFVSSDLLVGADGDSTASIYDARVGGGFAEGSPPECQGEGCRPQLTPPPPLPSAATPVLGKGDNFESRRCPKGKKQVKRKGKVRCVKKKKSHKSQQAKKRRAGAGQKGGRR